MTTLPSRTLPVLLGLALAWLAPLSASAKNMRFPEKGVPAYAFVLPDDWSSKSDTEGNLMMLSANRTTVLVILVAASTEALEVVAKVAFETAKATASPRKEPAEISGCAGFTWFTTVKNTKGDVLNLEMTVVQVDAAHFATASLILVPGVSPADEATARLVRNGLKLVTKSEPLPPLPNPVLVLDGLEYYEAGGKEWTRYKYRVANLAEYPDELFAAAPELPPCGLNKQAARTWVDFFDESGKRLYGFCAFQKSADLGKLWFPMAADEAPPDRVYIEISDRKTNTSCKSNLAPTTKGPSHK